jgi:hypothetical protein|tara:strand:+ start:1331 stop:2368 length:1038 start_codon:yes stop_codon:yes gene_type:complete
MADTQEAPQEAVPDGNAQEGSLIEAQNALLKLMEPAEETPETEEEQPTEEEEAQPEEEAETTEEEPEESEEEDDEGADDQTEEEEDLLYAVTVNGEEQEVTLDELLKGYSRQSDYTRKTQEISEQRKKAESVAQVWAAETDQIRNERQQYMQTLQNIIDNTGQNFDQFAMVDWDSLKETNPIEYVTKREEYRELQERIQSMQHEQHAVQQKQAEDAKQLHAQTLHQEHKLLVDALPEWGDPEKQREIGLGLRDYARNQGFADQEISDLVDHRSLLVLRKAMLYDKLNSSDIKSKKLKNKPRVVRSGKGASKSSDKKSKRTKSMKRLKQTGHIDDAVTLLEDMMNS